uniref:Uncharacterized protein n=1 Tax=Acrobeloides nanus TaxID=290746 RepID=A0A914ELW5_9BILA
MTCALALSRFDAIVGLKIHINRKKFFNILVAIIYAITLLLMIIFVVFKKRGSLLVVIPDLSHVSAKTFNAKAGT